MIKIKILFILIVLNCTSCLIYGQTLLGIKGGLNFSTIFQPFNANSSNNHRFTSYPSFCFEFNLKGRKPTHFHAGLAISYSQDSFKDQFESEGHFPIGKNITYNVQCVRITIFPELTVGKRCQFFFNLSPYLNIVINSSKSGSTWSYEYIGSYYELVYKNVNGSANDDFCKTVIGFQESVGFCYQINSWFGITFEENGSISCINLDPKTKSSLGNTIGLKLLLGVAFTIPSKTKDKILL